MSIPKVLRRGIYWASRLLVSKLIQDVEDVIQRNGLALLFDLISSVSKPLPNLRDGYAIAVGQLGEELRFIFTGINYCRTCEVLHV